VIVPAAGALPWRRRRGRLQVAVVHRPRYDDWSWPKGKLDGGEEWPVAAVREVFEETGLHVRLGRPLPTSAYPVPEVSRTADTSEPSDRSEPADQSGTADTSEPANKVVRYWAAEVSGGDGRLVNEIDQVAWLDVGDAAQRLSHERDRDQLAFLVEADRTGTLTTWPLVIVRHAHAMSRSSWGKSDPLRPLDDRGRHRAQALVPILAAYGVTRVVTSPSARCLDTVRPYAVAAGLTIRLKPGLSEEGFAKHPDHAPRHLTRLLARGTATVLSGHGPVLPMLLNTLAGIVDPGVSGASLTAGASHIADAGGTPWASGTNAAKLMLSEAAESGMAKGEALVAHLVGTGDKARIVDIEVYAP